MNIKPKKAGQRLNQFIDSLDISKAEFSRETGLNYAHMFRIINGDGDPGFDTCSKISEAYQLGFLIRFLTGFPPREFVRLDDIP